MSEIKLWRFEKEEFSKYQNNVKENFIVSRPVDEISLKQLI